MQEVCRSSSLVTAVWIFYLMTNTSFLEVLGEAKAGQIHARHLALALISTHV